jgi:hypothetical protein
VKQIAFSADGRTIVSAGGFDATVLVWDVASGKEVRRWAKDRDQFLCLDLSRDGRTAAWAANDGTVRLTAVATGEELARLVVLEPVNRQAKYAVSATAFSPDGTKFAAAGRNATARVWEVATGRELPTARAGDHAFCALAFSPDGRTLATGSSPEGFVRLWEVATGKEILQIPGQGDGLSGLAERPISLAFSADGRALAAGRAGGTVRLWQTATGEERGRFVGHRGHVHALAFLADGRTLVSASNDTTALLWAVAVLTQPEMPSAEGLQPKELEGLWADLAGEDAARAHRAVCRLAAAPREVLPFLQGKVRPAAAADAERLAQLIKDLDSNQFAARKEAAAELEALGDLAEPALRRALQGKPSPEVRRRIEGLLHKLQGPVTSLGQLRLLRVVEALERAGTPETRRLLEVLAKGTPESRLTQEAKQSLERLAARRAAGP